MKMAAVLLALSFLYPALARGDVDPATLNSDVGCKKWKMCDAETDTGVCQRGSTPDEIVAIVDFRSNLTFYSDQGEGAYVCDMITNSEGHDAASGVGKQFNVTSLTPADPVISLVGLFDFIWVNCSAVGTQATVILLACPASR